MKLNIYISFLIKDNELLGKHKEISENIKNRNLIVNQYTMKNN